jgi:dihydropteroate synthase
LIIKGADLVSVEEELNRIIPVIKGIRKENSEIIISVDTFYSQVAEEAIKYGANLVNDVSGGKFDENMIPFCSKLQIPLIFMHMKGNPKTMSDLATYENVVEEVFNSIQKNVGLALNEGKFYRWNVIIDPGLGFAKKAEHSMEIIKNLTKFCSIGFPVLIGPSRKGFISKTTNEPETSTKIFGTMAVCSAAIQKGADIIRIHDVKEAKYTTSMMDALYR